MEVVDLSKLGKEYAVYNKGDNTKIIKKLRIIEAREIIEAGFGLYDSEWFTPSEYMEVSTNRLKGFRPLGHFSWMVTDNLEVPLSDIAELAMREGTDVVILEFSDDFE